MCGDTSVTLCAVHVVEGNFVMGTLQLEVPITKFVVVRVKYFNTCHWFILLSMCQQCDSTINNKSDISFRENLTKNMKSFVVCEYCSLCLLMISSIVY